MPEADLRPRDARSVRLAWSRSTAPGALVDRPGRLYAARLVAEDPSGAAPDVGCALHDGADATGPLVLVLASGPQAGPDDWPNIPISVGFQHGLFPAFTAGEAVVFVYWEVD